LTACLTHSTPPAALMRCLRLPCAARLLSATHACCLQCCYNNLDAPAILDLFKELFARLFSASHACCCTFDVLVRVQQPCVARGAKKFRCPRARARSAVRHSGRWGRCHGPSSWSSPCGCTASPVHACTEPPILPGRFYQQDTGYQP
jgi:hypothetical protein